ncbi:MAG: winged helix-turn-helix transcriptional regulator [Oscillospiraceae bacterium]|nr:winged helix-turn-helix transcriptional regulator [Oscillospiraceae bacterium]
MDRTKHTLNELLVGLFNYILYIEEKNLHDKGVKLTMHEVHTLESIQKTRDNSMTYVARRCMVAQSTLTSNVAKLEKKGYAVRYKDENDKRITRVKITDKALEVLKIHDDFHEHMINKAVHDLGLDENELLIDTLENILEYLREEYHDKTKTTK